MRRHGNHIISWLLLAAGVITAVVMLLLPIKESFLGTSVQCGTTFTAVDAPSRADTDDIDQGIATQCQNDAKVHGVIAVVTIAAGLGTCMIARYFES
jgi:hypothetical protein